MEQSDRKGFKVYSSRNKNISFEILCLDCKMFSALSSSKLVLDDKIKNSGKGQQLSSEFFEILDLTR